MAKRKRIEVEDRPEGVSPVSAVVWSGAAVGGLLVVYNIFMGQPPDAARMARLDPAAQTDKSNRNTVVLRYDPLIEEVQRELLASGHYKGLVDGVSGNRTRDAILAYQRDNNLSGQAVASQELLEHIRFTRKITDAAEFTASTEEPTADPKDEGVADLQQALAEMGFDPGEVTGTLSNETREAIKKFEAAHGLVVDGRPDEALRAALARSTGKPEKMAGAGN